MVFVLWTSWVWTYSRWVVLFRWCLGEVIGNWVDGGVDE